MNWNDLEIIWRKQEVPRGANADLTALRRTFETKSRKWRLGLFVRNALEGFGGLLMAAVVAVVGWHFGAGGWRLGIGASLIFAVSLVFTVDLFRARCSRPAPSETLLA